MHGDRIVDAGLDALRSQIALQLRTIAGTDRVHMIDVARISACLGRHCRTGKQSIIERRVIAPAFGPLLDVLELDAQNRPLNSFQAIVESLEHVMILRLLAPVAQHSNFRGEFRIAGDHCPALSVCAEILAGIETETAQIAETSRATALIFGAVSLRGVFDHSQSAPACDLQDRIHVGSLAAEMDGKNCLGARGDRALDFRGVHREVARIDVDEHRPRAAILDRRDGRDERVRHGDDFGAGADACRQQRQVQRTGSRIYADRVIGAAVTREVLLERGDVAAQNELGAIQRAQDCCVDLRFDARVLRL